MRCNSCENHCLCGNCVRNPLYAINTPDPCPMVDCDICFLKDMAVEFCNQYYNLEMINQMLKEKREKTVPNYS